MKRYLFLLILCAIACMMILCEDSRGQEGCGRWVKPIVEKYRVGDYCNHNYMWVIFKVHQESIPDSVFVLMECPPKSPPQHFNSKKEWEKWKLQQIPDTVSSDTACWHWEERWVIGNCWEAKVDQGGVVIIHPVWIDPPPPDTCWHLERYIVYEPCE